MHRQDQMRLVGPRRPYQGRQPGETRPVGQAHAERVDQQHVRVGQLAAGLAHLNEARSGRQRRLDQLGVAGQLIVRSQPVHVQ
jgi:hypothetical protein